MTAIHPPPGIDVSHGLKPVQPLLIERDGDLLYASAPTSRHRVRLGADVVPFLLGERALSRAPEKVRSTLIRAGLVEPTAAAAECADSARKPTASEGHSVHHDRPPGHPIPWNYWGSLAWSFHNRTQDATFLRRGTESFEQWQHELQNDPAPTATALTQFKHESPAVLLPRARARIDASLQEVLENRRTHRSFADRPVDLDTFATVMHFAFGPMRFADARELGTLELRSYVSGGARHETTAVVAALNVTGLEPGLYVYDQIRHGLVLLEASVGRGELERLTGEQGFHDACGFSVLTVADTAAMAWKYRHPRAYRHLMNNVGAFAQVFSMVCHALGLGAAITGALNDSGVSRLIGLETHREIPTFSLSAGHPATDTPTVRPTSSQRRRRTARSRGTARLRSRGAREPRHIRVRVRARQPLARLRAGASEPAAY